MSLRSQLWVAALAVLLMTQHARAGVCASPEGIEPCSIEDDPIAGCIRLLDAKPRDIDLRLTVCNLMVDDGKLNQAKNIIDAGFEHCDGRMFQNCRQLEFARSNLAEFRHAQQNEPEENARLLETHRRYCQGPLSSSKSIEACERLLGQQQATTKVYESLLRKLLKTNQSTRALSFADRAKRDNVSSSELTRLIGQLDTQRQGLVRQCTDNNNINDCDAALLPGAADEQKILLKRAELLLKAERRPEALRSLLTAQSLDPEDVATANILVGLDEDTFGMLDRNSLLRAKSSAFRTLNDSPGEIAVLEKLLGFNNKVSWAQMRLAELKGPAQL